jgi:penicillin-insensitive murein endopeptidase
VPLPTSPANKLGYSIDFDVQARYQEYVIDFEAIGEHLVKLDEAARRANSGLALVIFDPAYLPRLFATRHGEQLKRLKFMQGQAWVRHDEHYHVDFQLACKPLKG